MEEQIRSGKYTLPKFAQDLPVLLVDRNKSLNKIKAKLEKFSYQVTGVNLASEALSMIWESKTCYKFVVADRNLPEMDYVSFVLVLRRREIPLIWMSPSYDGAKQALLDGASSFLIKPISSNDLKPLWQLAFRRRSNQKESHGAGGAFGSAARLDLLDIENKQVVKKEQVNQRDKEEGLITTTNNQQEGSKHKRLIDDQQGSMQDKRTKYNKSESILEPQERDQNERRRKGDGNRNAKGKECPVWVPELEGKFQAAIRELGPGAKGNAIFEKMNDRRIKKPQVISHLQKYNKKRQNKNVDSGATTLPFKNNSFSSLAPDPGNKNLPNFPPCSNQNQYLNTNFAASSSSTAEVAATTKLVGSEQARMTSGIPTYPDNFMSNFSDGIQNPKPMDLGPSIQTIFPYANQNQDLTAKFSATFNSNCTNQFPAGVATTTAEPLGFEQATIITSGIATNSENIPTNFTHGMPNLQPIAERTPAAGSSGHAACANQIQDLNTTRAVPFSTRNQSQFSEGEVTGTNEPVGSEESLLENFLVEMEQDSEDGSLNHNQPIPDFDLSWEDIYQRHSQNQGDIGQVPVFNENTDMFGELDSEL